MLHSPAPLLSHSPSPARNDDCQHVRFCAVHTTDLHHCIRHSATFLYASAVHWCNMFNFNFLKYMIVLLFGSDTVLSDMNGIKHAFCT